MRRLRWLLATFSLLILFLIGAAQAASALVRITHCLSTI
ncbi:MAG: hypothetical protein HW419_4736 [Deltaproteobacteria bacterium]|nr:hypothetical protein [Deltaproteobacteria bacterium]